MARQVIVIKNRLALERILAGHTVESFAHALKTTPNTFSKLERGLTKIPREPLKTRLELYTGYSWETLQQPVDLRLARGT